MKNVNSGAIKQTDFIKGSVLYYTTDRKHNNLLYKESFYSQKERCKAHVFENLKNEDIILYEKDFDENYSINIIL